MCSTLIIYIEYRYLNLNLLIKLQKLRNGRFGHHLYLFLIEGLLLQMLGSRVKSVTPRQRATILGKFTHTATQITALVLERESFVALNDLDTFARF